LSRSPSPPPLRCPPIRTYRGSSAPPPAVLRLASTGRKSHYVRGDMMIVRPSETLKKLRPNHGVLPCGALFVSTQLPPAVTTSGGSRAWYTRAERPAAGPRDRDLEGPTTPILRAVLATIRRLIPQIPYRPAPLFRSTTVASDRPAPAKSSMAQGCRERGIHRHDAAIHLPDRMIEQT